MTCDLQTLLDDGCTNGFLKLAQNETLSRSIILQLLYIASGGSETEDELLTEACTNGFDKVAQNEIQFRRILLQLFCNSGG